MYISYMDVLHVKMQTLSPPQWQQSQHPTCFLQTTTEWLSVLSCHAHVMQQEHPKNIVVPSPFLILPLPNGYSLAAMLGLPGCMICMMIQKLRRSQTGETSATVIQEHPLPTAFRLYAGADRACRGNSPGDNSASTLVCSLG